MRKVLFLVLLLALLVATILIAPTSALAGNKVEICHQSQASAGAGVTIQVSENAVPAHLAHGDSYGSCPYIQNTCPFGFMFASVADGETLSVNIRVPVGEWAFDLGTYCSGKTLLINGDVLAGKQGLYLNGPPGGATYTETYVFENDNSDSGNAIDIYWVCFDNSGSPPAPTNPPVCQ